LSEGMDVFVRRFTENFFSSVADAPVSPNGEQ